MQTKSIYLNDLQYEVTFSGCPAQRGDSYSEEGSCDTYEVEEIYCVDYNRDVTNLLRDGHTEIMELITEDYI